MSHPSWYRGILAPAFAAMLCVPALAVAQGIQPHVPLSTTLGEIARMRTAYVDAINAKDAVAVNAMYTGDAVVLAADGSQITGAREIAQRTVDPAATWSPAVVRSTGVKVYGATAIDVGTWTVRTATGSEVTSRYLAVLRHDIKGWKFQNVAVVPATK